MTKDLKYYSIKKKGIVEAIGRIFLTLKFAQKIESLTMSFHLFVTSFFFNFLSSKQWKAIFPSVKKILITTNSVNRLFLSF